MPREPRISGLRRVLRRPGASVEHEVDDEIAFHLESRARELVAGGMAPDDARRRAESEYGDLRASRRELAAVDRRRRRREGVGRWLETTAQDFRYAVRVLGRSPGYTATVIACVALGVGLTTTIVGAVNAVLLRPLPYADADRLVALYGQNVRKGYRATNISYPDYAVWRQENRTFSGMAIWSWRSYGLSSGSGDAERVNGADVAANMFSILGVNPILGRQFLPEEEQIGNDRVALLGHGLWMRRYGGDSSIVGRTITVNAAPYRVVGVMPPDFAFPARGELWTPFSVNLAQELHGNRGYAGAIGRLAAGETFERAQADLARVSARLERDFPNENADWAAELIPLRTDLTGDLRRPLLVFLGGVGIVLLIVCANVANLSLARGIARARELGVRVAIGADRGRIVRQLLTETLLLTTIGGALGAVLATFGIKALGAAFPDGTPFYIQLKLDGVALSAACLLSIATGILFGVIPAMASRQADLGATLRDGARTGPGHRRSRVRSGLVMAEIALSVILMIGAGLLVRSYARLAHRDLGFQKEGTLTFRLSLPGQKYAAREQRAAFYDALLGQLSSTPGVLSAGSAQGIPFSGWDVQSSMVVDGEPVPRPADQLTSHYQWATPGFFDAMGIPLVAGRGFTAADRDSVNVPGIVNETFARRFFGNRSPLGRRVRGGDDEPWVTIVGVARDHQHYRPPQPMGPAIVYPYATSPLYTQTIVLRTSLAQPEALVPAARAAVRALDPDVPLYAIRSLSEQVSSSLWRQRLQGQVLGVFAAVALTLAIIGIYGVISYGVTQRYRELGVRVALGATPSQVLRLVFRHGMLLTTTSIVIGVAAAALLARTLESLLFGVDTFDPLTFVSVPAVLGLAAMVATLIPARRASRVDPLEAIRAE
jgi:putative ABC transport system permease protein